MNAKDMRQFAQEVLNTSGIREALRRKISQIERLESLESLTNLRLTRVELGEEASLFLLFYEGTASGALYPHVKSNLIKQDVITRRNAFVSGTENQGQPDEYEYVTFGVSGRVIQVFLKAYNPDYTA